MPEQRETAHHALRELEHHVVAMEAYVATDALRDVATADVYVGIICQHESHDEQRLLASASRTETPLEIIAPDPGQPERSTPRPPASSALATAG